MCTNPHLIHDKKNHCYMEVPCRVCMECRLNYTKEWAVRVCNEACCHKDNCFITLTFDDEHLKNKSLDKSELQRFFKRLRKLLGNDKIRYFACGEYGGQLGRKHYHANIFGWFPGDAYPFKRLNGYYYYRSPMLEKLWNNGYSLIGEVNFDTARYVASYIVKQHRGKDKKYYKEQGIEPEFVIMSQGIGKDFVAKHKEQLKGLGYIPFNGFKCPLPRYYENKIFNEEEKEKRKNDKFEYLEKARRIFEENLDFLDYKRFADSYEKLSGYRPEKDGWVFCKRREKEKTREKRLKEMVERTRKK